jgi:hypothetical protein
MRWSTRFLSLFITAVPVCVADGGTVWVTPHEQYSSSVGVLGCKVDVNRIAYWPASIDCNNICVSLSYEGRTVNLLRIDQSQGAHDVSYDAWNLLVTGESATKSPTTGGAIAMEYQDVAVSDCADLIHTEGNKLPLSASNSMNFLASCLAEDTWVGKNHILFNILDPICTWGYDEDCTLDWPTANQATCPHQLGLPDALTSAPVYNIQYGTGKKVLAGTSQVVDSGGSTLNLGSTSRQNIAGRAAMSNAVTAMAASFFAYWLVCAI